MKRGLIRVEVRFRPPASGQDGCREWGAPVRGVAARGLQMQQRTDPVGNSPEDVPDDVVAQAKAAFTRRSRGEIAILTWDSMVDEDAPAEDHRLRFEHPELQIELRLFTAGNSSDLEGSVKPPVQLQVELQGEEGDVLASAAATGGVFAFSQVPSGTVRLVMRAATTPQIRTDWFRL